MGKPSISNLVFELTGACNQCCRFCYNYWRGESAPIPSPDPALARKTLGKLLRQVSVGTISFSGGEPLLLKNIHDLILLARFRGSSVNVLTNGTLIKEDTIANFTDLGVGAVQIPLLSADASVHDFLTQLPGSWEKASASMRRVAEAMPGGACAVLVVTKVNAPGVADTLDLIQELGVKTVMVNRFNVGGMGIRNVKELQLDRDMLRRAFADAESFASANPDMHLVSGVCTPLCLLDPALYPHIRFSSCSMDLNRRPVTLNYTGDVRFCNHSPYVLGNIHERSIMEILEDRENVARYSAVPEKCRDCSLLQRCAGGCRAAAEQVYGSFAFPDPVLAG